MMAAEHDEHPDGSAGPDGERPVLDVLVVDDDPEIAELVRTFLERADDRLSVTTATGAPAGLDAARERGFDAVVTDYHMPTMDGLAFLDRLAEADPETPGVVFSSDDAAAVERAARDADVRYVHKRMRSDRFERLVSDVRAAVRERRS